MLLILDYRLRVPSLCRFNPARWTCSLPDFHSLSSPDDPRTVALPSNGSITSAPDLDLPTPTGVANLHLKIAGAKFG